MTVLCMAPPAGALTSDVPGSYPHRVPEPVQAVDDRVIAELRATLLRAVERACPNRLASEREDIVQTVMARLTKRGITEDDLERLTPAYLAKTAYHAIVDELRRRKRPVATSNVDAEPAPNASDPEQAARARELGRAIRACLERLVQTRRAAVSLYLAGSGIADIARALDWRSKQADNAVYRGMGDMRRCLTSKGFEP